MPAQPGQGRNSAETRRLHGTRVNASTKAHENLGQEALKRLRDLRVLYAFHTRCARKIRKLLKAKTAAGFTEIAKLMKEHRSQSDSIRQLGAQIERIELRLPATPAPDAFAEFDGVDEFISTKTTRSN